jgi:hypothetical protein
MLVLTESGKVLDEARSLTGEGVVCCVLTARDLNIEAKIDVFNRFAKNVLRPRMVGTDPKEIKNIMESVLDRNAATTNKVPEELQKVKVSSDKMEVAKMALTYSIEKSMSFDEAYREILNTIEGEEDDGWRGEKC